MSLATTTGNEETKGAVGKTKGKDAPSSTADISKRIVSDVPPSVSNGTRDEKTGAPELRDVSVKRAETGVEVKTNMSSAPELTLPGGLKGKEGAPAPSEQEKDSPPDIYKTPAKTPEEAPDRSKPDTRSEEEKQKEQKETQEKQENKPVAEPAPPSKAEAPKPAALPPYKGNAFLTTGKNAGKELEKGLKRFDTILDKAAKDVDGQKIEQGLILMGVRTAGLAVNEALKLTVGTFRLIEKLPSLFGNKKSAVASPPSSTKGDPSPSPELASAQGKPTNKDEAPELFDGGKTRETPPKELPDAAPLLSAQKPVAVDAADPEIPERFREKDMLRKDSPDVRARMGAEKGGAPDMFVPDKIKTIPSIKSAAPNLLDKTPRAKMADSVVTKEAKAPDVYASPSVSEEVRKDVKSVVGRLRSANGRAHEATAKTVERTISAGMPRR